MRAFILAAAASARSFFSLTASSSLSGSWPAGSWTLQNSARSITPSPLVSSLSKSASREALAPVAATIVPWRYRSSMPITCGVGNAGLRAQNEAKGTSTLARIAAGSRRRSELNGLLLGRAYFMSTTRGCVCIWPAPTARSNTCLSRAGLEPCHSTPNLASSCAHARGQKVVCDGPRTRLAEVRQLAHRRFDGLGQHLGAYCTLWQSVYLVAISHHRSHTQH